jgi:hypothetical protein
LFDTEDGGEQYRLCFINRKVRFMFQRIIRGWFARFALSYNGFVRALLNGTTREMNHYMNRVALDTISFFDSGNKPSEKTEPERFYYGFVLGLLVELRGSYAVTSNREERQASCACLGRYDIMLEPCQTSGSALSDSEKDAVMNNYGKDAIIIEFTVLDSESGKTSLAGTVQDALEQIDRMQYAALLEAKCIPAERIRKYGFASEGEKVLIG